MPFGAFGNLATEYNNFSRLFPGLRMSVATIQAGLYGVIHRESQLAFGCISVSARSLDYIFSASRHGQAVAILPGGSREQLDAIPKTMNLTLKNRKGFIKMALKHGVNLVPVITFGENDTYMVTKPNGESYFHQFQEWCLKTIGFAPVNFSGRCGVLPLRVPLTSVIGAPIQVNMIKDPTTDQIDEIHNKYCEELVKLYDEHKANYGYGAVPIVLKH